MHRDDLLEAPAPAPQHGSLLEDWPRRASSREAEADQDRDGQGQGDGGSQSQSQSRVYFSEISMLHVYDDFDYMHVKKGYSKQDREIFTAQAIVEANRIRNLIIASPPDSVSESIKFLAENNLITREELVGIDHLIGRRTRVMQVRRNHMAAVLWKQHEQRRQQQLGEDSVIDLGKFAAQSSLKSTHHAIARASLVSSSPQNQDSLEHHRLHCFD